MYVSHPHRNVTKYYVWHYRATLRYDYSNIWHNCNLNLGMELYTLGDELIGNASLPTFLSLNAMNCALLMT